MKWVVAFLQKCCYKWRLKKCLSLIWLIYFLKFKNDKKILKFDRKFVFFSSCKNSKLPNCENSPQKNKLPIAYFLLCKWLHQICIYFSLFKLIIKPCNKTTHVTNLFPTLPQSSMGEVFNIFCFVLHSSIPFHNNNDLLKNFGLTTKNTMPPTCSLCVSTSVVYLSIAIYIMCKIQCFCNSFTQPCVNVLGHVM